MRNFGGGDSAKGTLLINRKALHEIGLFCPLGRGLLRRRWSGLVFDLLVRVSVVVVELRRLHHALSPEVPVLRDVDPVLVARDRRAVVELVRLQRGERDLLSGLDAPVLDLLRERFSHVRVDARVHQDVLEVIPRYGPAVRRLLRDALPGAAVLRLVDPRHATFAGAASLVSPSQSQLVRWEAACDMNALPIFQLPTK